MRVLKVILKILGVIIFIVSVTTSVVLGLSTSTLNAKSFKSRYHVAVTADTTMENASNLFVTVEKKEDDESTTLDKMYCSKDSETEELECTMISTLTDKDGNLVKTSYFPGDGYKYSVEGENKTKILDVDMKLNNYTISIFYAIYSATYFMVADGDDPESGFTYDCKTSFSFKGLSLNKEYTVKYDDTTFNLSFDGHDRLIKISAEDSTIELSYKKVEATFPSFEGYVGA